MTATLDSLPLWGDEIRQVQAQITAATNAGQTALAATLAAELAARVAIFVPDPGSANDSGNDRMLVRQWSNGAQYALTLAQIFANRVGAFNVRDYGAKGDGTTDDAASITAALNAAGSNGGGAVYLPKGTYKIGTSLPMIAKVSVFGDGMDATVLQLSGTATSGFTNYNGSAVSFCRVSDLTIDGNYNVVADGGSDNTQIGIYAFLCTDSVFERIHFKRIWYVGIEIYNNSNRNQVRGCLFTNVGDKVTIVGGPSGSYYGVGVDFGSNDCLVTGCSFTTCGHGVHMTGDGGTCARTVISGNAFVGMGSFAFYGRQGVQQLAFVNNVALSCGAGFFDLYDDAALQHNGGQSYDIVVANNIATTLNTAGGAGVQCIGVTAQVGVRITNNVVRANDTTGSTIGIAVLNAAAGGGAGATGYTQAGSLISGNNIGGTFTTYSAVRVDACTDVAVMDNYLLGDNATTTGVTIVAGATRTVVSRNVFSGCPTKISDAGTASALEGESITWTPAWSSSGTQPALGNGTIVGRYTRSGRRVSVDILLTMGSSTTFGTGVWFFSVPIAGNTTPTFYTGPAQMIQTGVADWIGVVRYDAGGGTMRVISTGGAVTPSVPFTWASTHQLIIHLDYEV